ncbi:MAG: RiPP maturation radical SAM C-methyltransferase [Desulfobacterales bacterium]|uniref:RiPP maturation radical SAM protein 1 n=1 Tax=Candidatus Desulfatibia profunda TaxID=2841695 RepID=A0A8J6TGN0_9BACT|nr:RiPP maturation radical SAM protein 1 [Candidatus Desulfatibia profunda]MBL7180811.1 RiPP maturation radical SAM C-methyltransferase [Desulfobacterales bacterium]
MQTDRNHRGLLKKVALISTPWPLFNRPSIQIGTLKSFLVSQFPDLKVDAHHAYLKVAAAIGYPIYQAVSEQTWLAESVYGALLFPERLKSVKKVFQRPSVRHPLLRKVLFETLIAQVEAVSKTFINSIGWGQYQLAGFSICFCQLTASLYFIKQIKKRFPNLTIVVGGSMFAGESIRNIFEVFPEIDFVVNGEGEIPLSRLVRHLSGCRHPQDIPPVPGIVSAKSAGDHMPIVLNQMEDLAALKRPDYDDYFEQLKSLGLKKTFFPIIPVELSRGCWWQRSHGTTGLTGCAFCNLNLQWDGYRSKAPLEALSEIDTLVKKHKTLSVAFMDNLLPIKASDNIFRQLARLGKDFRLFGEIRASTPKYILTAMQAAGMAEVQIGIEALSTRLLSKLNKGTTAIQNLEIMKHCEAMGIVNRSNLILHFPGSDDQDVAETLRCLDFALPFRPLKPVRFWLGQGSPVWQDPKAFGLKAVFNHPNYAAIFGPEINRTMRFTLQAYRGDLGHQKKLWQPVVKKLKEWKSSYADLYKSPAAGHILSYRDGCDFLMIRQKRVGNEPLIHRLEGTSRAIYLFCEHHRSIKSIAGHFPGMPTDKILAFLNMMAAKKLMFAENGKYLGLAVPARSHHQAHPGFAL